jgi:hypothetical protein
MSAGFDVNRSMSGADRFGRIGDDEVEIFGSHFFFGSGSEVFAFKGKTNKDLIGLVTARPGEDISGGFEAKDKIVGGFFQLKGRSSHRRIIGDGGGHNETVATGEFFLHGGEHIGGGNDTDDTAIIGYSSVSGSHNKGDIVPQATSRAGQGNAHPTGTAIGNVTDGIDGFTCSTGGDENVQAFHFGC